MHFYSGFFRLMFIQTAFSIHALEFLENRQAIDIHFVTHCHYCTAVAAEVQNVARRMSERAKPAHQLITVVNMPNEEALVFATVETLGNLARLWGTRIENRTSHRRALYTTCSRVNLVVYTKRV